MNAHAKVRAQVALLPGGRLHLNDGPIELVIGAFGAGSAVKAAYAAATRRFSSILDELCEELPLLRSEVLPSSAVPHGPTAQGMDAAVRPFAAECFITRMAAVAGAVADEILAAMIAAVELDRAYVNNGGDIAVHLAAEQSFAIGMVDRPDRPGLFGKARIVASDGIGGIATSGRRGRSFSLGIADAVTILAANAATADAAATIVANAVDLPDHSNVTRVPACDLDPQSDLGARLVTRDVGFLSPEEIAQALSRGEAEAQRLLRAKHISAAALHLQSETRSVTGPQLVSSYAESSLIAAKSN
ncbi:MAG: uncharacterized protein QOH65_228 [Methylobacteriaceae bacterium]|nr:uncharacterized protein [Methylobacteriaceae bacterium]